MKMPLAVALAAAAALVVAAPAQSSTTLGQVLPNPDGGGNCGESGFLQALQIQGGNHSVPAGGGIITTWSTAAKSTANATGVRLMVMRAIEESPGYFSVVGVADPQTVPQGTTGTFPTRIAVQEGDRLGLAVTSTGSAPCYGTFAGGRVAIQPFTAEQFPPDPNAGYTTQYSFGIVTVNGTAVNVAATLEADADGDGYGDETQDLCPTDAAVRTVCPGSPGPDPGTDPKPTDPTPTTPDPTPQTPTTPTPTTPTVPKPVTLTLTVPALKAAKGGKASGTFSLPAAGKLSWKGTSGKTVVASGSKTLAKGKRAVSLTLNAAGKKLLKKKGKLAVKLTFTLAPAGGKAVTASRSVTFRR